MDGRKNFIRFSKRQAELNIELERVKSLGNEFDCVVPVSGGKDGSYVAYTLKINMALIHLLLQ